MQKKQLLDKVFDALSGVLTPEEQERKRKILEDDIEKPVKIIGIGQTGVGKTELLRSIFDISQGDIADYKRLKTGATKSVTKDFFSFTIRSDEGFAVQFTDGPGLGESEKKEEEYLRAWINEIPNHDLLYWVLDGSSRDIYHIQMNMRRVLDETNYRNKIVVVLNKVDQILLDSEEEAQGIIGWDRDLNIPSDELVQRIKERTDDVIEKLVDYVELGRDQIVVCSARRRWNHDVVFDKFMDYLPPEKRIKASRNRDVKDFTELMTEKGKRELRDL